jgi:hypothetical protein
MLFVLNFGECRAATLIGVEPSKVMDYSFSGIGSGSLGGIEFLNSAYTFTVTANTNSICLIDGYLTQVLGEQTEIQVAGFELGMFSTDLRVFQADVVSFPPASRGDGLVALSLASGPDLLNVFHTDFATYDMVSEIESVTGVPNLQSMLSFNDIPTTLGPMTLISSQNVTVSVVQISEPSAPTILGVAVISFYFPH